ncbi:MAG TPA: DUF1587 domain-containing protein, partial [Planctomycetaceae bacterium]|nr:DUF1587 domain-containing protein [Planctomycetaceae bacterium]
MSQFNRNLNPAEKIGNHMLRISFSLFVCLFLGTTGAVSAESKPAVPFEQLSAMYEREIHPLLKQFCLDCHSAEDKEGELDLEQFVSLPDVREDAAAWQKVRLMLQTNEMPPEDSPQPSVEQKKLLQTWVENYLDAEALANAGDPGPVLLRRLNNAEYTYTIRELTGIDSLDPAREFPVDGAAGEGFTNTGNALSMSPAMIEKYVAAGGEVASHLVLLPDGIRFSEGTTSRDWSNEIMAEIRRIYLKHTTDGRDTSILDRWSVADPKRATLEDGRLDLSRYFAALIRHRD